MVTPLPSQTINKERGEIHKVLKQAFFREEEKTNQTKKPASFFSRVQHKTSNNSAQLRRRNGSRVCSGPQKTLPTVHSQPMCMTLMLYGDTLLPQYFHSGIWKQAVCMRRKPKTAVRAVCQGRIILATWPFKNYSGLKSLYFPLHQSPSLTTGFMGSLERLRLWGAISHEHYLPGLHLPGTGSIWVLTAPSFFLCSVLLPLCCLQKPSQLPTKAS